MIRAKSDCRLRCVQQESTYSGEADTLEPALRRARHRKRPRGRRRSFPERGRRTVRKTRGEEEAQSPHPSPQPREQRGAPVTASHVSVSKVSKSPQLSMTSNRGQFRVTPAPLSKIACSSLWYFPRSFNWKSCSLSGFPPTLPQKHHHCWRYVPGNHSLLSPFSFPH